MTERHGSSRGDWAVYLRLVVGPTSAMTILVVLGVVGMLAVSGPVGPARATGAMAGSTRSGSFSDGSSPAMAEIVVGFRGGIVFAQHTGTEERGSEYEVDAGWRTGFMAGAFLFWPVTARFGLQQEFLYVQKGSRQQIDVDILEVPAKLDVRYEMDYVELPILFRFAWLQWPARELYSIVGTALSLKVRDRYVLRGEVHDGEQIVPLWADADMAEVDMFDYAFVYGMGADVAAWGQRMLIEYRFVSGWNRLAMPTYAYVPFEDDEILVENEPVGLKNQTHSISVGIRF